VRGAIARAREPALRRFELGAAPSLAESAERGNTRATPAETRVIVRGITP
jgi:hypothetical protein